MVAGSGTGVSGERSVHDARDGIAPILRALREACVTLLAAILTLACALAIAPGPGSGVLAVVLCLSLYVTNAVNYVTLMLTWLFVILRYAHAAVHLTTNRLSLRFRFFGAGLIVLGIGWLWFALHIAGAV